MFTIRLCWRHAIRRLSSFACTCKSVCARVVLLDFGNLILLYLVDVDGGRITRHRHSCSRAKFVLQAVARTVLITIINSPICFSRKIFFMATAKTGEWARGRARERERDKVASERFQFNYKHDENNCPFYLYACKLLLFIKKCLHGVAVVQSVSDGVKLSRENVERKRERIGGEWR